MWNWTERSFSLNYFLNSSVKRRVRETEQEFQSIHCLKSHLFNFPAFKLFYRNLCLLTFDPFYSIFLLFSLYLSLASASQRDSSSSKDNNPGAYGSKQNALDLDAFKVGPYFDKAASKNVTALLGKTAYLNCRVKNLGNKTVSILFF